MSLVNSTDVSCTRLICLTVASGLFYTKLTHGLSIFGQRAAADCMIFFLFIASLSVNSVSRVGHRNVNAAAVYGAVPTMPGNNHNMYKIKSRSLNIRQMVTYVIAIKCLVLNNSEISLTIHSQKVRGVPFSYTWVSLPLILEH